MTTPDPIQSAIDDLEADPLYGAQRELEERRIAADKVGDWRTYQLLGPLVDVADHTRRVALDSAGPHYQAEKAGVLLRAAQEFQQRALLAYAGWPEAEGDDLMHPTERALDDAFELLDTLRKVVAGQGWGLARSQPPTHGEVVEIRDLASKLTRWADQLDQVAVDDDHYD